VSVSVEPETLPVNVAGDPGQSEAGGGPAEISNRWLETFRRNRAWGAENWRRRSPETV